MTMTGLHFRRRSLCRQAAADACLGHAAGPDLARSGVPSLCSRRRSTKCLLAALLVSLSASAQLPPMTPTGSPAASEVTVRVDLGRTEGPAKPVYNWFGYDEANYTTTADGRQLLRELHDHGGARVYAEGSRGDAAGPA